MKKTNTIGIIVLVLLLTIGFAAVATTLVLNVAAVIGANQEDFDVYFSKASTDVGGTAVINPDTRRIITYTTKELKGIGEKATLEYTVMNNSSQYDADVSVTFTATNVVDDKDYTDYYSITRTGFDVGNNTVVRSKKSVDGTIVISLLKPVLEDVEIEFTLTLTVNATERIEEGIYIPLYEIVSGDLDTVGSEVKIADEEFYVIGQEDSTHVKLLTKYNLGVGYGTAYESKQDPTATAWVSGSTGGAGSIGFASTGYWGTNVSTYPEYVYTNEKENNNYKTYLAEYIEEYVEYLETYGVRVTGRLISKEEIETVVNNGNPLSECYLSSCASDLTGKEWIHSVSYWTGTASSDDRVWEMRLNGQFSTNFYYSGIFGVRPVIILEK